jgi:hypothetical protein
MKTNKRNSLITAIIVLACLLTVGGALGIWAGVLVDDVYFANREDNLRYQEEHLSYLKNVYYSGYTPKGEQTFCNFNLQEALDSGVKYNEVAFLATHNSYQRLITDQSKRLQLPLNMLSFGVTHLTMFKKNDYENDTLTGQFEHGIRSIELDVEARVEDGNLSFVVMHEPVLDSASTCIDFEGALEEISMWSDHNPNHLPITILLEAKSVVPKIDGLTPFDIDHAKAFDALLRKGLGDKLMTPAQMLGDYATFKDMREADGWKPLKDMLGKVVVVLHESSLAKAYIKQDETMRTQAMFPSVLYKDRDIAQAGFVLENNPRKAVARIDFYREQNYMVRTRADSYPKFTDKKYALAGQCVSNIISTDYCPRSVRLDQHTYSFDGYTVKLVSF